MAKKILIVDDEPSVVKGLRFSLEKQEGYLTDVAYDGETAIETFEADTYDLVLLDLMLPKIGGMEVCQRIRSVSNVPIIMLTAKGEDMDKIMGLEYGADDYLTKPFNMLELKARIKNILRRAEKSGSDKQELGKMEVRDILIDQLNRNVVIRGKEISLTAKEFELLQLFALNQGHVFDRESLLDLIWKQKGDLRTVDVHIRRLREKIEQDPANPVYIITKWGVGYYFSDK